MSSVKTNYKSSPFPIKNSALEGMHSEELHQGYVRANGQVLVEEQQSH